MITLPTTVAAVLAELDSGSPRGYAALSDLMEFDSPITIHEDGTITHAPDDVYAPELFDDELSGDGWELLNGYSGQYGYAGPIMHPSEFIGGGMARDILSEPGTYVAVVAYYSPTCRKCGAETMQDADGQIVHVGTMGPNGYYLPNTDADADHDADEDDDTADGWAVARRVSA